MKGVENLMFVGWMLFSIYILVLLAICADLWSGVQKAKERGEARSSEGYRRTIDKIRRYYNALIALTVIDAMQILGVWYLMAMYDYTIPIFPIITLIGAIGIGLIEVKSIHEKADEKNRKEVVNVAKLAIELLKNKEEPVEAISKFLNENSNKDGKCE